MKILFAGTGFKFAANKLIEKIDEINNKIDYNERLELIFQDSSRSLLSQIEGISVIIPTMEKIDESIIKKGSNSKLKLIQQFGVGLEGIDIDSATKYKIYVANAQDSNAITLAESVFFLMLSLSKRSNLINKAFKKRQLGSPVSTELYNKTLGIIGLGRSGTEIAKRAIAFGMKVIAIKKTPNPELAHKLKLDFLGTADNLDYILKNSDFITLNLPANEETINLIDIKQFEMMEKKPYIINVARGPIIKKEALISALERNLIKGVALDVYWNEPPDPKDDLFTKFDNVITTPHIGGTSVESVMRMADIVVHNILAISKGKVQSLKNVMNKF
ncbi:MAG: NAD(P)-dependent oxidoreductase [Candidatus Helarchaeota archaeon]